MILPAPPSNPQARLPRGADLWSAITFSLLSPFTLFCLSISSSSIASDPPLKDQPHLRRPAATAWIERNKILALANRCGSVSVVDVPDRNVLHEVAIGQQLADITAHPKQSWLLAVDGGRHELVVLAREPHSLRVIARYSVSKNPVSIAVSRGGARITVASLWSRKVTIFAPADKQAPADSPLKQLAVIDIPFNPRNQNFEGDDKGRYVAVQDAFSNRSARIDTHQLRLVGSPQILSVIETRSPPPAYGGPRPPADNRVVIDGVEIYRYFSAAIPLGPAPDLSPAQRGELLFYDNLAREWQAKSCHSCHVHGHTIYELADTLADGTTGTPKRIPTLLGTRLTDPWAWNGKFRDLHEQVRSSLETTMHVKNVTPEQMNDIAAFLHTLPPPPPLEPATEDLTDKLCLARGRNLFTSLGCATCHVPPLTYTSPDTYDVGLEDEKGIRKFNPPSLRGVSQGYSFFHDGRAKSLEEVFTIHGHQLDRTLTDSELSDLLRFLRSL